MTDLIAWLNTQYDDDEAHLHDGLGGPCEAKGLHLWPPQALNDLAARRRILDIAARQVEMSADAAELLLTALALPYADRPGYRPEWTPQP
jgi:hypothetical protein